MGVVLIYINQFSKYIKFERVTSLTTNFITGSSLLIRKNTFKDDNFIINITMNVISNGPLFVSFVFLTVIVLDSLFKNNYKLMIWALISLSGAFIVPVKQNF